VTGRIGSLAIRSSECVQESLRALRRGSVTAVNANSITDDSKNWYTNWYGGAGVMRTESGVATDGSTTTLTPSDALTDTEEEAHCWWQTIRFIGDIFQGKPYVSFILEIDKADSAGTTTYKTVIEDVTDLGEGQEPVLHFAAVKDADGEEVEFAEGDLLAAVADPIDVVIANPPYLVDDARRAYRDGGGRLGGELAIRIVEQAVDRLRSGGQLVRYTGSPVMAGVHPLRAAIEAIFGRRASRHSWWELDPDVFGEELERPPYRSVERIAAIALIATVD
jgi:hypothetical protein